MRIFNEDKTQELQKIDLENGYLCNDTLFIKHHEEVVAVEGKYHEECRNR